MKLHYNYLLVVVFLLFGCATPVQYEKIDTPEERIRQAQTELQTFLQTAEKLKARGVIKEGTKDHLKIKSMLGDAERALQAAITALGLKDMVSLENHEQAYINALYELRRLLDE